jgi:hypothetical protein
MIGLDLSMKKSFVKDTQVVGVFKEVFYFKPGEILELLSFIGTVNINSTIYNIHAPSGSKTIIFMD